MKNWTMITRWIGLVVGLVLCCSAVQAATITVTDQTPGLAGYLDGFTIAENQTIIWESSKPVTGAIVFAHATTSILQLNKNLTLTSGSLVVADGGGCTIDGKGNRIEIASNVTWKNVQMNLRSPLTIVGHDKKNHVVLTLEGSVIDGGSYPAASLTLQELKVIFSTHETGHGVCAVPLVLNNVGLAGKNLANDVPERNCLMAGNNVLVIQGLVTTVGINPISLVSNGFLDVFLDAKGTLQVASTFNLVRPEGDGACAFNMDKAATLFLSSCTFNIGSGGVMLDMGTLHCAGNVTITGSGDFVFGAGLVRKDEKGAALTGNFFTRKIINDTNAKQYLAGFTVPIRTVYEWNCSNKSMMIGNITVQNGGALVLKTDLWLAKGAVNVVGTVILNGKNMCVPIDSKDAKTGLTLRADRVAVWADSKSKFTGPIKREQGNETSILRLAADLHLGAGGMVAVPVEANGRTIYSYNKAMVVGISDANYAMYKNGFTIPAGVTYEWAAQGPLTGPVTFSDASSVLKLGTDLHLGVGGSLVPRPDGGVKIDTGDFKVIVLDVDYVFDGKFIESTKDYLMFDGQGHSLTFHPAGDGHNDDSPGFLRAKYIGLENINLALLGTNNVLCGGANFRLLQIGNKVAFSVPGQTVTLMKSTESPQAFGTDIFPHAMLYVGPNTVFNPGMDIFFENEEAVLYLDGCDLYTGASTLKINGAAHGGVLMLDHKVNVHSCAVGDAPSGDTALDVTTVTLKYLNGATLTVDGAMIGA